MAQKLIIDLISVQTKKISNKQYNYYYYYGYSFYVNYFEFTMFNNR